MLRTISRIITALIILVLLLMGILLTATLLWPDSMRPEKAPENDIAIETPQQEKAEEIPSPEIKTDESVIETISALLDGLNVITQEESAADENEAIGAESIPEDIHEAETKKAEENIEDAYTPEVADEATSEEAYESIPSAVIPVESVEALTCPETTIETETAQGEGTGEEGAYQNLATPPSEEPSPYIPVEPPLPEVDPWADFYIQGEDDLLLEDSIYYMDLYVSDEYKGNISVLLQNGIPYLYTEEIKIVVFDSITTEAYDRIFLGQGENISLEELEERGVETAYDSINFRVDLYFSIQDMPIKVISLSSKTYSFQGKTLSDAEILEPAVFTLKSSYGLSLNWSLNNYENWNYILGLSVRNEASLFDVFTNFSYSLRFANNKLDFTFGSYSSYYDFVDEMLRLSWGNVFSGRTSPMGTPVGFTLSKSTAYGDGTYSKKNDYNATIDIVTESEVEVFNEGKSIFKRTLQAGTYRLEDFVLYSGVNKVNIRITPTNGSAPTEITKEFSWYSSMLSPGEFYYTLSFAFGREKVSESNKREGALAIPYFDSKVLQYDPRNFGASFDMSLGLAHTLSFAGGVSVNNAPTSERIFNPSLRADAEFTHINFLGTTRYNSTLNANRFEDGSLGIPSLSIRIGHQASTGWKPLSSINFSASYTGSRKSEMFDTHAGSFSVGMSGRLGFLGWSSGFSSNIMSTDINNASYSVYATASTSLGKRGSLSSSLNISGSYKGKEPVFAFSVYASFSFKNGSMSTSASAGGTRVSANAHAGSHSFNASITAPGWNSPKSFKNPDSYAFSTSYGTSFGNFALSLGLSGDIRAKNLNGSAYLSTSSVFADGLFAFTPSIPSNFLLIQQKGILKGNELSAGTSGSSRFTALPTTFSTAIYQGGSSSRSTDLMLYSTPKDSMQIPTSIAISMPPTRGRGYVYRMATTPTFSIAATIENQGVTWINGSSPLYRIENNELVITDEYVFTDENGLMLVSGLTAGSYAFDIPSQEGWVLAVFTIDEGQVDAEGVNIFTCSEEIQEAPSTSELYIGIINTTFKEVISSDDFWARLYPDVLGGGAA